MSGTLFSTQPVRSSAANGLKKRARWTSMTSQIKHQLAILATLALAGCGAMPSISLPAVKERNDFKGKPLSAVTERLGFPDYQRTVDGQKTYVWRIGQATQECLITVVMAGDIVDSYNTSGDSPICGPFEARAN
jgi:hypothetical protein